MTGKQELNPQMDEKPTIHIHKKDWRTMCKAAERNCDRIKAFALYCKRGKGTPFLVCDFKPIEVVEVKPGVFYYVGMIYPDKSSDERFAGTLVIRRNLEIDPHYAYWMGVGDYDFTINLRLDGNGEPEWKAYWVHRQRTRGEFIEIHVNILT
jgi:hypothetical protein